MLSLFPSLLSWQEASPLAIRVVLAAVLIHWAYRALRAPGTAAWARALAVVEGIAGALILIGFWTQLAAAVVALDLLVRIGERVAKKSFLTDGVNYYLILLVLALSLIVTGAGWWAFDLSI